METTLFFINFCVHFLFLFAKAATINQSDGCYRQQKLSSVGFDAHSLENIEMDVGECRRGQYGLSDRDNGICVPQLVTVERLLQLDGLVKEVETIQKCQLLTSTCQRRPYMFTFYPGTQYTSTIDVGACLGQCQDNTTCRPTRNITKNINTANGARCIQTIADCSCVVPHCYRMSAFEGFPEQYRDLKGNFTTRTKMIDIGRCTGDGCPRNRDSPRRPLDQSDPRATRRHTCYPKAFTFHPFVSTGGRHVNVSSIVTCTCE